MICRFRKLEPSLSSIKEKSLESRRVRTQPCTNIGATGAVWFKASLTEVGDSMAANWTKRRAHSSPAMDATARVPPKGPFRGGPLFSKMGCSSTINLLADDKHAIDNRGCEVVIESSGDRCLHARLFLLHHRLWRQCP